MGFLDKMKDAATKTADQARKAGAALYRRAGVTELVLTFAGSQPTRDIAYLGGALAELAAAEVR